MTKDVDLDAYLDINLVGTPDQVCEKVAALAAAGCEHLTALLFVGNTVDEMRDQIRAFARHVMPAFAPGSGRSGTSTGRANADLLVVGPRGHVGQGSNSTTPLTIR
jgi:hypothetical protein